MSPRPYDPKKAHQYYEEHKHLKGRQPGKSELNNSGGHGTSRSVTRKNPVMATMVGPKQNAQLRVVRLTQKISKLQDALKKAEAALLTKRKTERQNSDGKTTAKEKQAAQKYRDTHKSQIAAKEKQKSSSGGGSSSSGSPSLSSMSTSELESRISRIKGLITDARQQLSAANSLAHSLSSTRFISHSGRSAVTS